MVNQEMVDKLVAALEWYEDIDQYRSTETVHIDCGYGQSCTMYATPIAIDRGQRAEDVLTEYHAYMRNKPNA